MSDRPGLCHRCRYLYPGRYLVRLHGRSFCAACLDDEMHRHPTRAEITAAFTSIVSGESE